MRSEQMDPFQWIDCFASFAESLLLINCLCPHPVLLLFPPVSSFAELFVFRSQSQRKSSSFDAVNNIEIR